MENTINNTRFILVHFIVLNHLLNEVANLSMFFEFTSPLLSVISGYLFFRNGNSYNIEVSNKLRKRFKSLIFPYLFWTLVSFLILNYLKLVLSGYAVSRFWERDARPVTAYSILQVIFWKPFPENFWYLLNLIYFLPFNYLLVHILKSKLAVISLLIAIILMYSFGIYFFFSVRFLPFYIIGSFLGYYNLFNFNFRFKNKWINILLVLVGFAYYVLFATNIGYSNLLNIIIKIVSNCFFGFVLICALNFLQSFPNLFDGYLKKYYQFSFFIFCTHVIAISFIAKIAIFTFANLPIPDYANAIIVTLITFLVYLLITYPAGKFLKKRMPMSYEFITGYR